MVLINEATQFSSTPTTPAGRSRRSGIAHQVRAFVAFESSVLFTGRPCRRRLLTARGSATTMPSADSSGIHGTHLSTSAAPAFSVDLNPPARNSEASPGKNVKLPRTTAAFTCARESRGFAVLCQLTTTRRPCMQFLFIGSRVSHSLTSHPASPRRSWPLVIVLSSSSGILTMADLHRVYFTPMPGTHKVMDSTEFHAARSTPRVMTSVR